MTMASESDIKECPCCRSDNIEVSRTNTKMLIHKDGGWHTVRIRCRECGINTCGHDAWDEQEAFDTAVEKWNRREGAK